MSYCSFQWISDYTYHGILDYMQGKFTAAASAQSIAGPHISVIGKIDTATGTAELEPLFVLPDVVATEPRVPGDYSIILRTAAGGELARYTFAPATMEPGPSLPDNPGDSVPSFLLISEMVPYMSGADQVVIQGPFGTLAQVSAGSRSPLVTVQSPNGGETLSGDSVTVRWAASDADGDSLAFSVEFSPDDGATWELVAHGVTGNLCLARTFSPRRARAGSGCGPAMASIPAAICQMQASRLRHEHRI